MFVHETLKTLKPLDIRSLLVSLFERLKPEASFLRLYSTLIFNRFAFTLFEGVLYAMVMKTHGYTALTIAFAVNVFTMTTTLGLIGSGKLIDHVGSRIPIIASNLIWILALLAYIFSGNLPLFFIAQILKGVSVALWDPALNTHISSVTTEGDRGRITGKVGAFKGIFTFPAPLIGATLFDVYGLNGPIILSLLAVLISTLLSLGLKK